MNSLKDYKISFIAATIIIITLVLILIIIANNDKDVYNNGICSNCGRAIEISNYYPPK